MQLKCLIGFYWCLYYVLVVIKLICFILFIMYLLKEDVVEVFFLVVNRFIYFLVIVLVGLLQRVIGFLNLVWFRVRVGFLVNFLVFVLIISVRIVKMIGSNSWMNVMMWFCYEWMVFLIIMFLNCCRVSVIFLFLIIFLLNFEIGI